MPDHFNLKNVFQVEAEKRARNLIVPTVIDEVKNMLRAYGQPVTLFGENVSTDLSYVCMHHLFSPTRLGELILIWDQWW